MAHLPTVLEKYRPEIEAELRSILAERRSPMYDMLRYHLGWIDADGNPLADYSGKYLRPTLCLLACEGLSGDYRPAVPAAAALELLHNYSLIHDDIQDDDRERRHRPTVWAVWGKPQAINAGTAMRILTNAALRHLETLSVPPEKVMLVQRRLDEASLGLLEGQYLDISFESRFDITAQDYLEMIGGKTAALIACSVELGALLGTDDSDQIEACHRFGWNLGLAFQIRDDILGIWGDNDVIGKPLASDIRKRKKTFPIVHALDTAKDGYKDRLIHFYRNGASDAISIAEVLSVLEKTGARTHAQEMNAYYCKQARQNIDNIALGAGIRQEFVELVDFLEERSF